MSNKDLAPNFQLYVEDKQIEIPGRATALTFEHTIGLADILTIELINRNFDLIDHRALQPGNNVDLFGGYGTLLSFIGRTIIEKHLPKFPQSGEPTLTVKGLDFSFKLMDESSEIKASNVAHKKLGLAKDEEGRSFVDMLHSSMVEEIAGKWGLETDIDATSKTDTLIQKKGISDYQFVRGLANFNDRDFWIDWNFSLKAWTLHWKKYGRNQSKTYTFEYGGEKATLLSFEPQYGMREDVTEVKVLYYDLEAHEWKSVDLVEGGGDIADPRYLKGEGEEVSEELSNAASIRVVAAGHSIDVIPDKVLHTAEEAQTFAEAWFRARKDHFLIGRGTVIGLETLRPRQTHNLIGLGTRFSGGYYFTSVKHTFAGDGYICTFTANKEMEPTDAVP
jgi:phage protein D